MAKKRGLASNRGLDALLGSIKTEKLIAGSLANTQINRSVTDESLADDHANTPAKQPANQTPTTQSDTVQTLEPSISIVTDQADHPAANTQKPLDNTSAALDNAPAMSDVAAQANVTPMLAVPSQSKADQTKTGKARADQKSADQKAADVLPEAKLNLLHIDVNRLQRGKYQPRIELGEEALQELASSIKQHGVMQPIVIRPLVNVKADSGITHEIIAGERRWRAAQIAGLQHIPAIIRPMSDDLAIALALIENIQREDLSVMEQAVALQRFHDEFGMSHAQIADVVGKARTTVSNLLRLNQLHDDVKTALNEGMMDMGHARALLSLSKAQQPVIARKIANEQLTVRQTEQLVKQILDPSNEPKPKELDYERLRLNQQLSEQLGAVVKVKGSSAGKGSIEIFFHNPEELQALLQQLHS